MRRPYRRGLYLIAEQLESLLRSYLLSRALTARRAYADNVAVESRLDGEYTLMCGSRFADGNILKYLAVLLLNELL